MARRYQHFGRVFWLQPCEKFKKWGEKVKIKKRKWPLFSHAYVRFVTFCGHQSIIIIIIIIIIITITIFAIELSLGGSGPYNSTDKKK